jgi:chromosome segregation ATPase
MISNSWLLSNNSNKGNQTMNLTDREQIQQELNQLKENLEASITALDSLETSKQQLTELIINYQSFQDSLATSQTQLREMTAKVTTLTQNLEDLEKITQSSYHEWKSDLVKLQNDFDLAKQNINSQFSNQLHSLKQEMDSKTRDFQQEIDNFKATFKQDLEKAIKQLGDLGFNPDNLKKIDKFSHQILETKTSIYELEKQVNSQKNWLIITILIALMALGFSGTLIIVQLATQSDNIENIEPNN